MPPGPRSAYAKATGGGSSKRARVKVSEKSVPSYKASISSRASRMRPRGLEGDPKTSGFGTQHKQLGQRAAGTWSSPPGPTENPVLSVAAGPIRQGWQQLPHATPPRHAVAGGPL